MDSFTILQARETLARDPEDRELLGIVDDILTFVLAITAAATGLSSYVGQTAFALLGIKPELTRLGRSVLSRLGKEERRGSARVQRLIAAHTTLFYTAFLDELPISGGPRAQVRSHFDELRTKVLATMDPHGSIASLPIPIPHPAEAFDAHLERVRSAYAKLTAAATTTLREILDDSAEDTVTRRQDHHADAIAYASTMTRRYSQLYMELALENPDFFVWTNVASGYSQQQQLHRLSQIARESTRLLTEYAGATEAGMLRIEELVRDIPQLIHQHHIAKVLTQLQNGYEAVLDQPIVQEHLPNHAGVPLTFPKAGEIYVPQRFSVLRYTGTEHLETEKTWEHCTVRDDLGLFLVQYLNSPHSETSPLIVLGHPGSGKSLLTNILAARLGRNSHTAIRVELRDVAGDLDIGSQVEEQIRRRVGMNVEWGDLAQAFAARPGALLFDGYDELLQVTGKVHAGYLAKVQQFQMTELAVRRQPVRAVVTSRLNLIDKAMIPRGATILRLREFDDVRRRRWIDIWNRCNRDYFAASGVKPFRLPEARDILALAEQPLLLLILAIYDSDTNDLSDAGALSQTHLYDRLIRRFVGREAAKSEVFGDAPASEQVRAVEERMESLGTVALGMFNRRALVLREAELDADLAFFRRDDRAAAATELSPASQVVGGFFFIHRSHAMGPDRRPEKAFEFLHNTFGEFLAADFILRRVVFDCRNLHALRANAWTARDADEKLRSPAAFQVWHSLLALAPLVSRPVILNMMNEWLPEHLRRAAITPEEFELELTAIIDAQVQAAVASERPLDVGASLQASVFPRFAFLHHLAIYTQNLITLGATLNANGYEFRDDAFPVIEDTAPPWHRVMRLWQPWFSAEGLAQFSGALELVKTPAGRRFLHARSLRPSLGADRLSMLIRNSEAIGDFTVAGLALLAREGDSAFNQDLELAASLLRNEGYDVEVRFHLERLRQARNRYIDIHEARSLLEEASAVIAKRPNLFTGPLILEAAVFAHAIGLGGEHYSPYEPSNEGLQVQLEQVTGTPPRLAKLAVNVANTPIDIPVETFASVIDAVVTYQEDREAQMLAAVLRDWPPNSLCPRLLVAAIRLATFLADRTWLAKLYDALNFPHELIEAMSDDTLLDLCHTAQDLDDVRNAAQFEDALRTRLQRYRQTATEIWRAVSAEDGLPRTR